MSVGQVAGSTPHVAAELGIRVAAKQQDQQKVEGEAAVKLIETAGDVQHAPPRPADGSGRVIDVLA